MTPPILLERRIIMIEVRLFATLREGRGKMVMLPAEDFPDAASIIRHLNIPADEVAILLINGFHSKPDAEIKAGDIVALFPPVGGG